MPDKKVIFQVIHTMTYSNSFPINMNAINSYYFKSSVELEYNCKREFRTFQRLLIKLCSKSKIYFVNNLI